MRIWVCFAIGCLLIASQAQARLRAGASAVDITPKEFPVIVNGMFEERTATKALDPLTAKALVLENGDVKIAIVVVDNCMLPRDLLDEAKEIASKATGIPTERMLISATHTHSAPSAMGCLGSDADERYQKFLIPLLAKAIEQANANLRPAKAGWAVAKAPDYTACRRWIFAPHQMRNDPFGFLTIRANMHPGFQNPAAMGPAGPIDPDLTMLSLQTAEGKPLALLANYSMHYFGSGMLSADYFAIFAQKFAEMATPLSSSDLPPLVMMSAGCSGDMWYGDYSRPQRKFTINEYSEALAKIAFEAYRGIEHADDPTLAMAETKLALRYRVPDEKRLAWAKERVAALKGAKPKAQPDIYAREQLFLAEKPDRELKLQAIRIGDGGIAAIPNEVYALTGLKIKGQSPLKTNMVIELANGSEGYIPPPEQHVLGGYTTWAARTAGLEVESEPKILEAVLGLMEQVSGGKRKKISEENGAYAQAVLSSRPAAYFRMGEADWSRQQYEPGVVFYLEGPAGQFTPPGQINRAPHFAGGRMKSKVAGIKNQYSVELWFWNAMPHDARQVTGYLISRGAEAAEDAPGDHLGIGGTFASKGKLIFFNGNKRNELLSGNTEIVNRTWNHLVVVRDGKQVALYLNGNPEPDAVSEVDITYPPGLEQFFIGGRNDNFANFEGKIDEVAIYDRALKPDEIADHFKASAMPARANAPGIKRDSDPRSPEEALALMHIKPGYIIEQVAAEPLVMDPVAIDWGHDGKLWVVEMADYPYGMDGKMKPGGRIKYLTDENRDGKYDKATLFLDGVNMPNGIITWRNGVIVTAAPEIFYAEDSNGDGKADIRKTLYKGFKEGNPQLRINSLRWGLDNWIHCANGWSGGSIQSWKGDAKLELARKDLRIRPDEGLMELESGVSQYGRNPDDWGNWFGCDNSHPLFHYVIEDRYLRRNPHVNPPDPKRQVYTPANPKVYPRSKSQKRYHSYEHGGHFTSACSTIIYRDELLFPRQDGVQHMFTCEPVSNLVQHMVVKENGTSFTIERAGDEKDFDFLASEDPWFRPVMVRTGPDGALWVVDMYRYMIEHPDWLPPQGKAELMKYFRDGEDKGRIYRVYPRDRNNRLRKNSNGWVRDSAQQESLWNRGRLSKIALEQAMLSPDPLARLHNLCTLDGLNALKTQTVISGMVDAHPAIRRQALRLAESFNDAEVISAAVKLANDRDAKVRLQLACSLGQWDGTAAGAALAKLAITAGDDMYLRGAVSSSLLKHYETVAAELMKWPEFSGSWIYRDVLNVALGVANRELMAKLLHPLELLSDSGYSTRQMQTLAHWHEALAQRNSSLQKLKEAKKDSLSERVLLFEPVYPWAAKIVAGPQHPAPRRALAASLLGWRAQTLEADVETLATLLTPQTPAEVQTAAVRSLGRTGHAQVAKISLENWSSHSPALRGVVADLLIGREAWAMELLGAMESGKVALADLDVARRERLSKHSSPKVRELAKKLLKAAETNRQEVVEANRSVLSLKGDRARGAKMFALHCATCHRIDNVGTDIGPALVSVAGWTGEALLTAVLDPDRAVEPRFISYTAKTSDDQETFGIITSESGGSITLRGLDGKEQTISRANLKSLVSTNHSLMPMGFESAMSAQEMADLIAYLQR